MVIDGSIRYTVTIKWWFKWSRCTKKNKVLGSETAFGEPVVSVPAPLETAKCISRIVE